VIQINTKDKVKIVVLIVIVLYFLAFLLFNMEAARIHFLFFTIDMPVFFLILFSALVGAGLVLGFSTLKSLRRPREESKPVDASPK
jgi:uncharacterized integral membrane protein